MAIIGAALLARSLSATYHGRRDRHRSFDEKGQNAHKGKKLNSSSDAKKDKVLAI
jgi:hypothetical protein